MRYENLEELPRQTHPVPSSHHQTLLSKALYEHFTRLETIACVAASSRSILNSSLAPNLASLIPINSDAVDMLFLEVFGPPREYYFPAKYFNDDNADGDENDQNEQECGTYGFCETLQFTHTVSCNGWPVILSTLAGHTKYFVKSLRRITMHVVGSASLLKLLKNSKFSAIEEISIIGYYVPTEADIAAIEQSEYGKDFTPESNEPTITLRKVSLELGQRCDHDDTLHLLSKIPAALELTPNSSFLDDHCMLQLVRKLPNLTSLSLGFHRCTISSTAEIQRAPNITPFTTAPTAWSSPGRRTDMITTRGLGEFTLACKKKFELSERVYSDEQNWWKPLTKLVITGWRMNTPAYVLGLKCICEIFSLTEFSIDLLISEASFRKESSEETLSVLESIGNLKNLRRLILPNVIAPSAEFVMHYFVEKLPMLNYLSVMGIASEDGRKVLSVRAPRLEFEETLDQFR